ncbi:MAG: hypothetical protein FWE03_05645 [Firmicutes bacterium]|nr:hypothetical protein [Bacillota bacterium]
MKRKIIILGMALVMLFSFVMFGGCEANRNFSEDEHIERISERVRERFFYEGAEHPNTGFSVAMLYSDVGNPDFFMVEFEIDGYVSKVIIGRIFRKRYYVGSTLYAESLSHDNIYFWIWEPKGFYRVLIRTEAGFMSGGSIIIPITNIPVPARRPSRNNRL